MVRSHLVSLADLQQEPTRVYQSTAETREQLSPFCTWTLSQFLIGQRATCLIEFTLFWLGKSS